MKKKMGRLTRYLLIINKLSGRQKYVGRDELLDHVRQEMDRRYDNYDYTLRTLQRDLAEILEMFEVHIKNRRGYGYYIAEEYDNPIYDYRQLLLNFDLLTSINDGSDISSYILAEHHRPRGSHLLPDLISAIKNSEEIEFDYTFVRHGDRVDHKTARPHFLKESLGLWYLLAKTADGQLKNFAIDRISNLSPTGNTFRRDNTIKPEELFRHSYGIWDDPEIAVEHVVLSYSRLDGSFIKAMPLHSSQKILVDTADEFRISVDIRITNDFVMALLARSASLTVISPAHLRSRIAGIYREALQRNS